MMEMAITIAVLAVLVSIAQPMYTRMRARSMQADAKMELTGIYTREATFKEETRTYHSNFAEMGFPVALVTQTDMSSTSNPYMKRVYAVSAGGPIDPTIDDAKPVTFASLGMTPTRPDAKNYKGWLATNTAVCGVTAAEAYGATGGATPSATSTTLLVVAKGCPKKYLSANYDVLTIDEDGIIRQIYDASGD
jgi:Tfp pilus assembly protein PilE